MSAKRSHTRSRLPLVYWRAVAPDDSDLLRRVRSGSSGGRLRALDSEVTLDQIAGPSLRGMAASASVSARLSPDGQAVEEMRSDPVGSPIIEELRGTASSGVEWARLRPANRIVVQEHDFKIPQLRVKNLDRDPVLLPAGSAFIGGAQNRMLLEPAVIPGGAERNLGVFCIEAGRWDESQPAFRSIGRVPSLFLLRVLESAAGRHSEYAAVPAQHQDLQVYAWETILAGLTLAGEVNPTMDLMAFARRLPRPSGSSRNAVPDLIAGERPNGDATPHDADRVRPWGIFHADRASGTAACALYPNDAFAPDADFALQADLAWRGNLLRNARGAREYYRIFDESKRLAVRCLPDGSPLRDLRSRPIVFEYSDVDLENSFRPPLQGPPPPEALSFAREPMIESWSEMLESLGECRVEVRKIVEAGTGRARPGGRAPEENKHSLRFAHPERSLIGSGLLIGGRPAYIEATAFRPYANSASPAQGN